MGNVIPPKFISLKELSQLTGRPLSTLRRWASERRFPLYRCSNRILISESEFLAWLENYHIVREKKED